MKKMRIIPWVFGILAFAAAAAALFLTTRYLHAPPVLVEVPDAALEQVEAMMDAVCEGDYEEAARHLYGCPDLGLDREPADPVGLLIWNAFADSLSYELAGECFATDAGLSQKVVFRSLEFESITEKLGERAQTLLAQRVEEAEDTTQIYDENNEYREDFVMEVLRDAAEDAIAEDARYQEQEITLNLTYRDGQWWIMPEQALISAISGNVAG